ncbi:MAG: DUF1501 domain-containing protein [Planctomycetota bacterium]
MNEFPCHRQRSIGDRREWLTKTALGFGGVALSALLRDWAVAKDDGGGQTSQTGRGRHGVHHRPRAKSIIFLYMDGGPSQVDTFDPKPMLDKHNGRDPGELFRVRPTQFDNNGTVFASPWKFRRYGESGLEVSDLFPHIGKVADELAVVRSMVSEFSEHTAANYFLHSGSGIQGRPCMGAWTHYGLGSESENLPGFIVLNGGLIPPGGLDCFSNGFLPADHQGSLFKPVGEGVANLSPPKRAAPRGREATAKRSLIETLDQGWLERSHHSDAVAAAIRNHELAYRMQMSVPDLMSIDDEDAETRKLYGLDSKDAGTRTYAAQCLLARRMVERGVRFIELTCPSVGHDRWDQHSNLKQGHEKNALAVDQPIGALIEDLKRRGLLDETLVVWAGEFGRTPFAQGSGGRDHNPFGFTIWMAGGGVRGGTVYGSTDEFGYRAIQGRTEIHDLHATMLHLLGVDHERSTFRFGGRDMRLTDVKGHVMKEVLA